MEDGMDVFVNRTNNPLERFNRRLNENIPRHPSMTCFIQKLKDITQEFITVMAATRQGLGRGKGKAPKIIELPKVPVGFHDFKRSQHEKD
jgi:hypothetical protein